VSSPPEIPPPPRTPRFEARAGKWRLSIPQAVLVALITTAGTTATSAMLSASDAKDIRARLERIEARLERLEAQRNYAARYVGP
jgi:sensor domain CHASE-containing protein